MGGGRGGEERRRGEGGHHLIQCWGEGGHILGSTFMFPHVIPQADMYSQQVTKHLTMLAPPTPSPGFSRTRVPLDPGSDYGLSLPAFNPEDDNSVVNIIFQVTLQLAVCGCYDNGAVTMVTSECHDNVVSTITVVVAMTMVPLLHGNI